MAKRTQIDPDGVEVSEADGHNRRCSAEKLRGGRCKGYAVVGSMPGLCSSHLGTTGRKPPTEDKRIDKLVQLLGSGNHITVALKAAAIPQRTYTEWREKASVGKTAFVEIIERVELALAEGEARLVTLISKQAVEDWRAAAWLLKWNNPAGQEGAKVSGDDAKQPVDSNDPFAALEQDEVARQRERRASGR